MINFVNYDLTTLEIVRWGTCQEETIDFQTPAGQGFVEGIGTSRDSYVLNGAITAYTADQAAAKAVNPGVGFIWSNTTFTWVDARSLADVQRARNEYVNTQRLAANQSSFTYAGKQIAVDPLSRSDIDGVNGIVTATQALPAGWPGGWKAVDNSYVTIATVADWNALYAAMVAQGLVNFAHAQTLKAQIAAATTNAEVDAIVW